MATYITLREANIARQKEWDKDDRITPVYRANELAGEIGEALERALDLLVLTVAAGRLANTVKKLERERLGIGGSRATLAQLAEELADVQICTDLVAMEYGIDLDDATRNKFNATSEKVGLKTRFLGADHGQQGSRGTGDLPAAGGPGTAAPASAGGS